MQCYIAWLSGICLFSVVKVSALRNLLRFLANYNHWLLFVLLEAVSVVLLFRYNSYQGSTWISSANFVSGKIYEWSSEVESFFSLIGTNRNLTERNLAVEQENASLRQQLYDATHDSLVFTVRKNLPIGGLKTISARVVSNTVNRPDNLITIDKGSADGVRADMGVVSGNGVVGIVFLAASHYSVVIPIVNRNSSISCTLQGRGYFGYLIWDGRQSSTAYLEDIPRHAFFKKGDRVVTNGYSSVFPEGILVGHVKEIYNSDDGLSYKLEVRLSNDFAKLRDVVVIDNSIMQEKLDVLHAAQDSLKVK